MDQQTQERLGNLETKIEKIYVSVEKTRKYFMWTMVITIAMVVLPVIGLALAIPALLGTLSEAQSMMEGL